MMYTNLSVILYSVLEFNDFLLQILPLNTHYRRSLIVYVPRSVAETSKYVSSVLDTSKQACHGML